MAEEKDEFSSRWWVETTDKSRKDSEVERPPVGARFFQAAEGYDQNEARERLTSNNWRILEEAQPPEGGWSYISLTAKKHPEKEQERIRRSFKVPPYARAVLVDSGKHVRVLVTGSPIGERVLEFTLGYAPSFDCWVGGDWVYERVFKNSGEVFRASRPLIRRFLSPEAVERARATAPQV